jgi:archaellum component FlaF (FlaF/FlaG flagellin family)
MKHEDRYDEPNSSRISLTSIIVCVGILVVAIVNQYLSQG